MAKRDQLREGVKAVLRDMHAVDVNFVRARHNCHWKVRFTVDKLKLYYVFPSTPSDHRAYKNTLAGVRTVVRIAQAHRSAEVR